ncbi:MAG TPA: trypsin-like peptidase domain-containing protein [Candidatus Nitrosopolaris sp.]|nr:trypsin-like peptidase domain-containing protein [Candidatus Nitrosopolaris sp.]
MNYFRITMTKIRELSLVAVIILLVSIIAIQSITNTRILFLIAHQPQQILPFLSTVLKAGEQLQQQIFGQQQMSLPFFSTIMKAGKQLQQQIIGQSTDNTGNCQTAALTPASEPAGSHNPAQSLSLTALFKQVENSVVQITSRVSNPNMQIIINGNPVGAQSTRLGSGFVYDNQGHIITNNHVVGNAKTVDVTFVDGNTYTATVVGTDPFSDIAVIKITDDFSAEKVLPLVIANSSSLQVGEQIVAIGNPFGLSDTMTTGIVSQMGRLLPNPDTGFSTPNTIQTDAAINPGNSGGPLLNMQGQVVGINTAINSATGEFSGIGFAVPSSDILRELSTLIQNGCYSHAWLGISGSSITADIAQSAGLPRNYKGVVVGSVQPGSPAEKAGLQGIVQNDVSNTQQVGDIITGIDGHPVRTIDDLINYIDSHKSIGDNVVVTVNRHGQILNLDLVLQTRPSALGNARPQESILP